MKWILLILLTTATAHADCPLDVVIANATVQLTDDPQTLPQDVLIERGSSSSGRCRNYRIYFSKGYSNNYQRKAYSYSGRALDYNIHPNINKAGILKEIGDATSANEYLSGQSPDRNTSYANRFFLAVPALTSSSMSGTYYDVIQAQIYSNLNGNLDYERSESITFVFVVTKNIDISLVDENAQFDPNSTTKVLDFGNITQGDEKGADLRVVSNTPYQVRMSAMNNGVLRYSPSASISYSMKVNGSTVGLSSSASSPVTFGSGNATSAAGDRYNLRIQITGSTNGLPAGLYQDAVTITAIAN